jgi:large subunit ribosomal protein L29
MMKAKELRNLSRDDVAKKVQEMEEELFNLRFQAKMGQLANALQLRMVRRSIARARTILAEKAKEATVKTVVKSAVKTAVAK